MIVRSTLIIDADDTLWENNIHFEQAGESFLDLVAERGGDRETAKELLMRIERRNVPVHGYGTRGFTRSMMDTLEEVTGRSASTEDRERILALGAEVRRMPIQFLPGVMRTLPILKERHRLILFTKGDPDEQQAKVSRSGARAFFHEAEFTSEKAPADYERLIEKHAIDRFRSWMVGNSPRSDVNPALQVGLGAVFIPHPNTWIFEHEEVRARDGARLMVLKRFSELLFHIFD
ncbi:MAG TPA: HAD family hydrolase [Vicinamibacteria bacterium]|nr:HAD family hydrolase [Vicinamibacteria bacterium]